MALQHGRAAPVEFVVQCLDDRRVIVSNLVNAVSGKEIEDDVTFGGGQFRSEALAILRLHLQQVEQPYPLRIHVFDIGLQRV